MKIQIRLYGALAGRIKEGEDIVEVSEGSKTGDIPEILGINPKDAAMFFVNHDRVNTEHQLHDGDILKIMPPITGG